MIHTKISVKMKKLDYRTGFGTFGNTEEYAKEMAAIRKEFYAFQSIESKQGSASIISNDSHSSSELSSNELYAYQVCFDSESMTESDLKQDLIAV